MKSSAVIATLLIFILLVSSSLKAEIIRVSSQQEFNDAQDSAAMNDSIIWESGRYLDIYMEIEKNHLFIGAENLGRVIFTGNSRVEVMGDYVTLQGFQFLDGDIGSKDVINVRGSHNIFTQLNIRAYKSYKYLRVREESQYCEITYCNFENRLNLDDQNILSILVDDVNPGYHKIQYCSFKNFDGTGNDLGIEPIRIGVSTQAEFISRTLVEFCYFTQCNGDGELISSKARQNIYRYNTFENNPKAELVLRHGSESIVYGNFFLNGKGGVRVREGQDHFICNNYFYNLDDRAIYLQNEDSDPLDNINIAFNTIVDCSEVILGGDGDNKPTNVTISNNIFSDPDDEIFEDETGNEKWIGNIVFGNLGIQVPSSGMTIVDPVLEENNEGFFGLGEGSPAINAAHSGYASLPQYEGMEEVDTEILFDLMRQNRPAAIEEKDLGSNEYPHDILISPIATEENTGPSYNTSMISSLEEEVIMDIEQIEIHPNPVSKQVNITILNQRKINLRMDIVNSEGRIVKSVPAQIILPGKHTISENLEDVPPGMYSIRVSSQEPNDGLESIQTLQFIKS
ncbi:chondroitinase-B domain-containing protein [Portibacter lacus]|uniref:Secretion system C-terminal sorting domain-containing protein n=1 Tax=Portibacter lacus TaxID=1099794 RepID=A0AA37WF86_9BACT|nr:chondroitinase-B domain-containing protein [Portibacter lacus]GLR18267.1 hypothetical protein GCM10007940_28830 [Portibacter lacus]